MPQLVNARGTGMHFFYVDESGDTGRNLMDAHQPIMVLGGISVRDGGWNTTAEEFEGLVHDFFNGSVPPDFELHAIDLLSPNGDGHFAGHSLEERCGFVHQVLNLLDNRNHGVHFVALDKRKVHSVQCVVPLAFDPSQPYLLGFDYLITLIEWYTKTRLGSSARAMVIADEKEDHADAVERIVRNRRREGPKNHRVKWVVEITYPVDSKRNPMIQISDLVIYLVRRFLELDAGHREQWVDEAKEFYAGCYARIADRIIRSTLVERGGKGMKRLNEYLTDVQSSPRRTWRSHYGSNLLK
jgi:hypothetical protein